MKEIYYCFCISSCVSCCDEVN